MSPCGTNINGNIVVDQLLFVALAPSPPVQSVEYYLRRKNGWFDFNAYLVLVYLINVNI